MFIVFQLVQMLMWLCWWLEIAEHGNNKALIYWPIHSKLKQEGLVDGHDTTINPCFIVHSKKYEFFA